MQTSNIEPDKATFNDALFIDSNGCIRDRHIEDMFDTLFLGRDLDFIFQNNFREYAVLLIGPGAAPSNDVFDNVTKLEAWASKHIAALEHHAIPQAPDDTELAHCAFWAAFRGRVPTVRGRLESAYAPTPIGAALLAVVILYRHVSQRFHKQRMEPSSKTHH